MPRSPPDTAILLMALGGPGALEEVGPYLQEVRRGRPTPEAMVQEFRERYRSIGGRSPLLSISRAQATALESLLRAQGANVDVVVGMRHWHPFVREAVEAVAETGTRRVLAVCLTPYESRMSVGAYLEALREACESLAAPFETVEVKSWNDAPALAEAFAAKVAKGRARLEEDGHPDPYVLFTAHSLPQRIRQEGDPYERELYETMELIKTRLPPMRSSLAYQSAGRTPDPWLGPPAEQVIDELARRGETAVLVVPFGFVSDNLEILYDVDVEFRGLADRSRLRLERTLSLNADPLLVAALADTVRPLLEHRAGA